MEKSFSEWLLQEMEERGLTQAELARMSGTSRTSINNVILQIRNPGPSLCRAIADALNIPPEEVFMKAGILPQQQKPDILTRSILAILDKLPKEEQEEILDYAQYQLNKFERKQKKKHAPGNSAIPSQEA